MLRSRVIPCLLIHNKGLVKTVQFKNPKYLGDPLNAVKIFNEKLVDELVLIDIEATIKKKEPNFQLIEEIASEAFMPIGYGGGVTKMEHFDKLFKIGVEKVSVNSCLFDNPEVVKKAVEKYGSQSIIASVDFKKNFLKQYLIYSEDFNLGHVPDSKTLRKWVRSLVLNEISEKSIHRKVSAVKSFANLFKKFA